MVFTQLTDKDASTLLTRTSPGLNRVLRRSIAISPTCDELLELISYLGVLSSDFGEATVACRLRFARSRQRRRPPRDQPPTPRHAYFRQYEDMTIKKS